MPFVCRFLTAIFLLMAVSVASSGQSATRIAGDIVPSTERQQVLPESVGYSSAMLETLRGWVKTQQTTSMIANANCDKNCK